MIRRKLALWSALLVTATSSAALAQSLKPNSPAALQPGINKGTVDNFVGTHYWYFTGLPGETRVHLKFTAMGLLGNSYKSTITAVLSDAANTWHTPKSLVSEGKEAECDFTGKLTKPTKLILSIAPPANGLVRTGGDYQVEATGAVAFDKPSTVDPVIGVYKQMQGYTQDLGDCKFQSDGKVITTSGTNGTWTLFDKDSRTYVINIDGQNRQSLQLVPGRGLIDERGIPFFQQLK